MIFVPHPHLLYIMDDSVLNTQYSFAENMDYMNASHISNYHLFICWKQNNSISIKTHQDDICLTIPSTISKRLENLCWRRWNKQLRHLSELSPADINWNKSQDITWLFGPKYTCESPFEDTANRLTTANLSKFTASDVPDLEVDETSSITLGSSMSFDDASLSSEEGPDETDLRFLKPALKNNQPDFTKGSHTKKRRKLVKFSYIVNSREFVNGILFDYDFLDTLCL